MKSIILLVIDNSKIDKSKFISLTEIGFSKGFENQKSGWIYTAYVDESNYNELKSDPNYIIEDSKYLHPI